MKTTVIEEFDATGRVVKRTTITEDDPPKSGIGIYPAPVIGGGSGGVTWTHTANL